MEFISSSISGLIRSTQNAPGRTAGFAALAIGGIVAASFVFAEPPSGPHLRPALTEEETQKIMQSIFDKLRKSVEQMMGHVQNIKQQLAQQGQDVPDQVILKQYIFPHFEAAFKEIESSTLEEFDAESFELEDAVNTYVAEGYGALVELSEKMKMLYKAMGGDDGSGDAEGGEATVSGADEGGQPEVTRELLLKILSRLSDHMSVEMDAYCKRFIAQNGGPPTSMEEAQAFQEGILAVSDTAEKKTTTEFGITGSALSQAIMAHSEHKSVKAQIQQLQMENMRVMNMNGFAV